MLLLSNWCPFSSLGRRTCPYPRCWECPNHCGSEARNMLQPWHFSLYFDALGWLHADWPIHKAVAMMVSAKCCLSYGECAKLCIPGVLKQPQNVKIFWQPFCFYKTWRKYTVKPQKCWVVRLATGRGINSLVFMVFFCILQYDKILSFAQVMMSEANGTTGISAIGPKELILN